MEGTFSSRFSAYCINFDFDAVQEIWTVVDHMVSDGCLMCLTVGGGFRMLRYAYASHAFLSCCMSDAAQNLGRKATSRMRGGYPPVCSVSVPRPWQRLLLPDCSLEILGTIHK